ncbi:MAG: hypothetical protein ACYSYL_14780 [Planctomycetota bacterium]|jgi:hypothetical protein
MTDLEKYLEDVPSSLRDMVADAWHAGVRSVRAEVSYAVHLQRAIEYHRSDQKVPAWVAIHCPHHAEMLDSNLMKDKKAGPSHKYGRTCMVSDDGGQELILCLNEHESVVVYAVRQVGSTPAMTITLHEQTAQFLRDWFVDQVRGDPDADAT